MENRKSATERGLALAKDAGEFLIGGDLRVTRLGFGAMRITGDGIWGEPSDRAEAVRVLRRAVALGINFIDTADSYGPGVSEEIIAEALHPYPAGLVIATKGGFMRPGPNQWIENGKPEHLRSTCEGSLRRLRLDQIDLYQLHRIDPKLPAEEQLGTLKDLQAQGKIKHIGLSEVSVADSECAHDCSDCEHPESLQLNRPRIGRRSGVLRKGENGVYSVVPIGGRSCFRL
jgi:aryl-alcohol dehydrogenase-like predicted oxidoreductase